MKSLTKILMTAILLSTGAAYAEEEPTDPNAIAREELMKMVGKNTKVLGDMAGDKAPYDAAAAEAAKAGLIEAAGKIAMTFETQGATDPASTAKPEIWTNWEDFTKKAEALTAAATAIDVASVDGIKAGMGGIGGACKACHETYRISKN